LDSITTSTLFTITTCLFTSVSHLSSLYSPTDPANAPSYASVSTSSRSQLRPVLLPLSLVLISLPHCLARNVLPGLETSTAAFLRCLRRWHWRERHYRSRYGAFLTISRSRWRRIERCMLTKTRWNSTGCQDDLHCPCERRRRIEQRDSASLGCVFSSSSRLCVTVLTPRPLFAASTQCPNY
jgi:hypothetical protein